MRKAKCIEKWLNENFPSKCGGRSIAIKLVGKRSSKLVLAHAMVIPFTKRLDHLKDRLELGKQQLGYQTCIAEVADGIESLLNDLDCSLSIFYKREYSLPVKKMLDILDETKQFKVHFYGVNHGLQI